jgi:hypothetical protein
MISMARTVRADSRAMAEVERAQGNRSDLISVGLPPKSLRDWERRLNLELKASIEAQRIEKLPEQEPKR